MIRIFCEITLPIAIFAQGASVGREAMVDRYAKVRRLASVGASQRQLVEVVSRLRETNDLDGVAFNRQTVQRALGNLWQKIGTTFSLPIQDSIEDFTWHAADLPRLLKLYLDSSVGLRSAFRSTWDKQPCSIHEPWHLVAYADEVVPGNVLRLDNKRKVLAIYVTVRELGPLYLCHQDVWFPVALIRSSIMKEVCGGTSAVMKVLFQRWFEETKIQDGFCVSLGEDCTIRMCLKLGNFLADGEAHRSTWNVKGAAGKLPCILCKNVLSERVVSDYLIHISCADVNLFDRASNSDIFEKADKLHNSAPPVSNQTQFKALQLAYGVTYNPLGVLWRLSLRRFIRPASTMTYDAMHCLLSNGIVGHETSALLSEMQEIGITWNDLRSFAISRWRICKAHGRAAKMEACFSKARETAFVAGKEFKAGASEMWLVFPILLHFLYQVAQPLRQLPNQIASYAALGVILGLYQKGKCGVDVADELASAIKAHSTLFEAAYSYLEFMPKHHWLAHVPQQMRRHHVILDAFVGERRHNIVKTCAADIKHTHGFEKSVLCKVICQQLDVISRPEFLTDSLRHEQPCDELAKLVSAPTASMSTNMTWKGQLLGMDDAIWAGGTFSVIKACCSVGSDLAVLVDRYTLLGRVFRTMSRILHFSKKQCFVNVSTSKGQTEQVEV